VRAGADPMVVLAIIVANVVVSVVGFKALRGDGRWPPETFLFIPSQVARGQNRLGMLLAHFSHAGVWHLVFNMVALYSFAETVLGTVGPARFLLIYVVAGLGSDLVVYAVRKNDPSYRCLGASGSVLGIVMAAVAIDPTTSIVSLVVPIPIPGPVFMLGYVIVSLFLIMQQRRSGISHEGHLGGALFGLAVTGLLAPRGLAPLGQWFGQWL
jgi:membrane associated rhomboid family serine protease